MVVKRLARLGRGANDSLAMAAVDVVLKHLRSNKSLASDLRGGFRGGAAVALAPERSAPVFKGPLADVDAYFLSLNGRGRYSKKGGRA
jgi:hypothetical protein